jgi:WD40 repeat protein
MAATQPFDPGHSDRVIVVHTNFNGTKILTGSIDHRIKVWDRDSKTGEKTLLDTFTAHDADIKDVSNDMPFLRPICGFTTNELSRQELYKNQQDPKSGSCSCA